MSPAKTAEPIEMPFGLSTRVGQGNHVLDGGQDPPVGKGNFDRGMRCPIVKHSRVSKNLIHTTIAPV